MELDKALHMVNVILKKDFVVNGKTYNLAKSGWKFKGFDRAVNRLGICYGGAKQIGLSKKMTEIRPESGVKNTILHEIAHAIDNEIRGHSDHSYHWEKIAKSIGCTGERCTNVNNELVNAGMNSDEIIKKSYKYVGICPTHGVLGGWARKPKDNKLCKICRSKIEIKENL